MAPSGAWKLAPPPSSGHLDLEKKQNPLSWHSSSCYFYELLQSLFLTSLTSSCYIFEPIVSYYIFLVIFLSINIWQQTLKHKFDGKNLSLFPNTSNTKERPNTCGKNSGILWILRSDSNVTTLLSQQSDSNVTTMSQCHNFTTSIWGKDTAKSKPSGCQSILILEPAPVYIQLWSRSATAAKETLKAKSRSCKSKKCVALFANGWEDTYFTLDLSWWSPRALSANGVLLAAAAGLQSVGYD